MEKVKRDVNRVDIAKLNADELSGEEVTGGYILKFDWGEDAGWETNFETVTGAPLYIEYVYPKGNEIMPQQEAYIQAYIDSLEVALMATNYQHPNGQHYSDFLDIPSFVDFFIAEEMSKDIDGYKLSSFMHKDKNGKLKAGPIWDFDIAWYNSDYCAGGEYTGWIYNENNCEDLDLMPQWWERLLAEPQFVQALHCRWFELRENTLATSTLHNYIDQKSNELNNAQTRNFTRWDILNEYTWAHPEIAGSYQGEVDNLKNWIENRFNWMDDNMPGECPSLSVLDHLNATKNSLQVYPNPSSREGQVQVQYTQFNPSLSLKLYDVNGKLLATYPTNAAKKQLLKTNHLVTGIYYLQLGAEVQKLLVY